VNDYIAGLPRKFMSAGVLFRSDDGRVLLVEPSYKPNWEVPGGGVDAGESPWAAAARELTEELGTSRPVGRLLVMDYSPEDDMPDRVQVIFDGGRLSDVDVDGFTFADGEILSAGFYTPAEVRERVKPRLANRIEAAVAAAEEGVTALCEQGIRIA
jgi:8-oxo-dGTP pyrophosphatase MutT (NUDIX family)